VSGNLRREAKVDGKGLARSRYGATTAFCWGRCVLQQRGRLSSEYVILSRAREHRDRARAKDPEGAIAAHTVWAGRRCPDSSLAPHLSPLGSGGAQNDSAAFVGDAVIQ